MQRREFLKSAAAIGLTTLSTEPGAQPAAPATSPVSRPESPEMVYRTLGKTGERVSAIGLGGYHVGVQKDPQESLQIIHAAVDHGITFLDNCWDYNEGLSEVRMGQALRNGYRQKVFLMTKMDARTRDGYTKQLEQSLGRLQTDMIDLVQFHENIRMEDADRIFAPGGALEAAVAAREAGKIRYIGFTGHKDPAVHLRMFEVADKHGFHFDTVQMPVNVMDAHFRSFTRQVIPVAQQHGTAVLAMKTFGGGAIIGSNTVQPLEALRYGLSQPVSVVITGMDSMELLKQGLTAAKNFQPMTQAEIDGLLERTKVAASEGRYELFKTTQNFDGTAQNPKWLS